MDRLSGERVARDGNVVSHGSRGSRISRGKHAVRGARTPQRNTHRRELRRQLRRADLPAVGEVRALLRDQLRRWEVPGLVDTAELLTSELVTNALVHTDQGAVFTARLTGGAEGRLRVEVRDFSARRPKPRQATDHTPSGRGLLLVKELADAWGVRVQRLGKTVWFELAAASA
ncbi:MULTISPECIES: ATP-binding protein [Streptomyces]|uniref:ATP-binding protein n=1 Tax=Streptomyces silvisoli TaxID=3034235 RepID=A0ABT5ZJU3_9ACTN|nr:MULTISPECIES: ATP-binding protein [Streptomyces]MDF3289961.1 ATP-binding protein [Streptomyces silvisoli]